jgi:hypothetical protein
MLFKLLANIVVSLDKRFKEMPGIEPHDENHCDIEKKVQ